MIGNSNKKRCIPCTVGILTCNSEETLKKCLQNISNFCEIIIADGGSTDKTLDIARKYNCKIISQSNVGHPIKDFSKERNRILDAASYDWFFWLDSDEFISEELNEDIKRVVLQDEPEYYAYEVRMVRMDPKGKIAYKDLRDSYQIRFFNRKMRGHFIQKIHERLQFNREQFSVKRLSGAWCVPLRKLDFASYRHSVDYRLHIMINDNPPKTFSEYVYRGIRQPIVSIIKTFLRAMVVRMRYPFSPVVPLAYERNRLYSSIVIMRECLQAYLQSR